MDTIILVAFGIGTIFLCGHVIKEVTIHKSQNEKLLENMRKHDKKSKK
tara:strand:+ start:508 stop:651 length:144 start_codon:yes stop_codon:yes gene_type:complete